MGIDLEASDDEILSIYEVFGKEILGKINTGKELSELDDLSKP